MSETLAKNLVWPKTGYRNVTITVVAEPSRTAKKIYELNSNNEVVESDQHREPANGLYYSWYLNVFKPGPDARHLDGLSTLYPRDVVTFLNSLVDARQKMLALANVDFDGEYKKDIDCNVSRLSIKVVSNKNEAIQLQLWVSSEGKYMYGSFYKLEQVNQMIETIRSVFSVGESLSSTLKQLSA
ncbi:conserved hypothetical protein [Vibrio chagasii]|uniref:Uncharacterized protein n=2 Tax=Vibrio TaxID=662 RepID=A0ABW7ID89_9VIBR|nr:hypothetical protein VCHA50P424_140017 [Vibrio chagasii]CAH7145872.1 hypothetical protein VCHA50O407_230017 [Vibrio chagasii]CAH7273480.1 conserved hypothetical protein [Vibrio chagasii]